MKHITIIVPDGQSTLSTVACIVGTYEIFIRANGYWKKNGKRELFKIELAGVTEAAEFDNGLLTIKPQASISSISKTNLIVIPSLTRDYQEPLKSNKLLVDWIEKQYKHGARSEERRVGKERRCHW